MLGRAVVVKAGESSPSLSEQAAKNAVQVRADGARVAAERLMAL
ncbi:hypothetical protein [Lentzea sp. NEAU-D7]|nr:hypothetical protein [Lentzea sp. NEAU-D7]MCX2952985.1 hypothetical protein [Lentzea sp. NEAU-D7]